MMSTYMFLVLLEHMFFQVTLSSNKFQSKWSAAINTTLHSYHISKESVIIVATTENFTETTTKTIITANGKPSSENHPQNETTRGKFWKKALNDRDMFSIIEIMLDFHDMAGDVILLRVEPSLDHSIVEDSRRRSSGRSTAPVIFLLQNENHPLEVLKAAMPMLSLIESWSPRAPHLVAVKSSFQESEETIVQVLGELWRHKVSRAAVLQQGPQGFVLRWWAPQGHGRDCEGPSTEGLVAMELSHHAARQALPIRRPYNYFSGCIFRCSTLAWLPYSIKGDGGRIVDGLDFRILDAIRELMNFTTIYSLPHETFLEAGNNVINGSSHFTLGGFTLMEMFYPAMDPTVAYWHDHVRWFVPIGLPIPRWLSVTRVFSGFLWLGVILSCTLVSGAFTILRIHHQHNGFTGPGAGDAVRMLLGINTQEPRGPIGSWIFAVWLLSCVIINFAYQSGLIGFLTNPGVFSSLTSVEELAQKKMKILTHIEYKEVLEGFDDPIYKIIISNTVPCEDIIACINLVASSQDYALPADMGFIARGYEGEGRKQIKLMADITFYSIHTFVEKGSPLLEWFDFYITGMVEGNLNGKWYSEIIGSRGPLGPQRNSHTNSDPIPMAVVHLQGVFIILIVGLLISSAVFVKEIVHVPCCANFSKSI